MPTGTEVERTTLGQGEIRPLTSLRGVAALYVVAYHFSIVVQTIVSHKIPGLVPHGYIAVDFFFVLSGFIMAYTYAASFRQGAPHAYSNFIKRRIARIVPLNTVVVTICILIRTYRGHSPLDPKFQFDAISNFMMLQGIGVGETFNNPSWSISVEFLAYFLFPFFLILSFTRRRLWPTSLVAVGGLYLLTLANPHGTIDTMGLPAGWTVLRCFCEFSLGVTAFRMYSEPRLAKLLSSDAIVSGASLLAGAIIAFRAADLLAVLLFPIIIIGFSLNQGRPARLMASPAVYFLGLISYSIYLTHEITANAEITLFSMIRPGQISGPVAYGLAILGTTSAILPAWLLFEWVEKPGRKFMRTLLAEKRAEMATSTMA